MDNKREDAYVSSTPRALIGVANGIILYEFIWPLLAVAILQLILQSHYQELIDTNKVLLSLILTGVIGVITLIASIFIAGPKRLLKAYHNIFSKREVKIILLTLAAMFAFSYIYNFILLICKVDVSGGNTNQQIVDKMIKNVPVLAVLIMVFLAPLNEEITYRYFVYGGIRKWNRVAAIIISGVIFMAAHATAGLTSGDADIVRELLLLPPYLFSGMALAFAYDRTDNLGVSTTIHVLNNLISFILTLLLV